MAADYWCFFTAAPLETFVGLVFFGQVTALLPAMIQLYWETPANSSSSGHTDLINFKKYRNRAVFYGSVSFVSGIIAAILYFLISKEVGFRSCPLDPCIAGSMGGRLVLLIYASTLSGALCLGLSFLYRQRALNLNA